MPCVPAGSSSPSVKHRCTVWPIIISNYFTDVTEEFWQNKNLLTLEGAYAISSVPYLANIAAESPTWSAALTSTMLISSRRFLLPWSLCNWGKQWKNNRKQLHVLADILCASDTIFNLPSQRLRGTCEQPKVGLCGRSPYVYILVWLTFLSMHWTTCFLSWSSIHHTT